MNFEELKIKISQILEGSELKQSVIDAISEYEADELKKKEEGGGESEGEEGVAKGSVGTEE